MHLRRAFLCLVLASLARAAAPAPSTPPAPAKPETGNSEWVFSLLPKSFQKNPRLELTVITEMTAAGKKLPPVSQADPAYYEVFTTGPRQLGDGAANENHLQQEEIEKLLRRSLATNGYAPATPDHPPSLLIIYTWGSHNSLREGDEENPSLSGQRIAANMLDRAALVGGEKFAQEMLKVFEEMETQALAPPLMEMLSPVNLFRRKNEKNDFLVDQTAVDVYYVVASAYDYRSAGTNRKTLLWRTRMTAGAPGINQEQSLPTLVLSAAPFFGREMTSPEIITKRSLRDTNVEIGPATVVEGNVTLPATPAASPAKK